MLLNLSFVTCLLKLSHGSLNGEIPFKTIWDQTHFCMCSGLQFWEFESIPIKEVAHVASFPCKVLSS